jgi:hypothetical protein
MMHNHYNDHNHDHDHHHTTIAWSGWRWEGIASLYETSAITTIDDNLFPLGQARS